METYMGRLQSPSCLVDLDTGAGGGSSGIKGVVIESALFVARGYLVTPW